MTKRVYKNQNPEPIEEWMNKIKCSDCKYWKPKVGMKIDVPCRELFNGFKNPDWFCGDYKERTSNGN